MMLFLLVSVVVGLDLTINHVSTTSTRVLKCSASSYMSKNGWTVPNSSCFGANAKPNGYDETAYLVVVLNLQNSYIIVKFLNIHFIN